jgi:prolipoprotein diacylglyceryltransferase
MTKWIKTILVVLVVSFCLYYLFNRPEAAASAVKTFFGAFDALGRFFVELSR